MKFIVTFYSQTGNTIKVARAIASVLPPDTALMPIDEVDTLDGYDLCFIGFPVMQFGPPSGVKKFIAGHAAGKRIALFITHAMVTGSDDPTQRLMLDRELEKCRSVCTKSDLAGLFHCQGALSEEMARDLIATNIPMLMDFAAMRSKTIGHPDAGELAAATAFARDVAGLTETF